jgi:NagD protein
MDGVLVHEGTVVPGAVEFLDRLAGRGRRFLVLTNNSIFTPRDLSARLSTAGLMVPEENIWTSALATAQFLTDQMPGGSVYCIGEVGLTTALHEAGYVLTDTSPDYVVLGETRTYSFEAITRAIRLVDLGGAVHCHEPRPVGAVTGGQAARHRRGRGAHHPSDPTGAILRR